MDFQGFIDLIKGLPSEDTTQDSDVVETEETTDIVDAIEEVYDAKTEIELLRKEMNDMLAELTDSLAAYIARGGIISESATEDDTDTEEYTDRLDFSDLDV